MKHTVLAVTLALILAAPLAAQQKAPPANPFTGFLPLEAIGISAADGANISNRLRHELTQTGAFEMMERERMQDLLKEHRLQQSGVCNTNACIVEVGQKIGVEKMVAGNVGLVGKTYTLNVRLIDVETGKVDRSVVEDYTGSVDKLLTEVVARVAQGLAYGRALAPGLRPLSGDPERSRGGVEGPKPLYKRWWFWTGLGAAAAGGTAAALLSGGGGTTEENPQDNTLPYPPDPPQAPVWTGGR